MRTTIFKRSILLLSALISISAFANTEIDDCIISGLKGVSSDSAARMIKQSCENKIKNKKKQENLDEYGGNVYEELEFVNWVYDGADLKMLFKNNSNLSATLIKINVSEPKDDGKCPYPSEEGNTFFYKVVIKPKSEGKFTSPISNLIQKETKNLCLNAVALLGRDPKWSDYQYGRAKPLKINDLKTIDSVLGTNFSIIPAPKVVPDYSSLITPPLRK